jgi:hypothetical protein
MILVVRSFSTYLSLQMKFKKQNKKKKTMVENNTLMSQQFKINKKLIKKRIN